MSLHHFFLEEQVIAEEREPVFPLRLTAADQKHARVLRLRAGEHISIVDGAQDYFELEIVACDGPELLVRIAQHKDVPPQAPSLVLVQGIAKGEKMDQIIRQCVEVGAHAVIPLACSRSIAKLEGPKVQRKLERWQAIARSAAMQSGRFSVPSVEAPRSVSELCGQLAPCDTVVVFWEEAPVDADVLGLLSDPSFLVAHAHALGSQGSLYVVVGPEGGLDQQEVMCFQESPAPVFCVSMGPSILRTETAAVVGCAEVALIQRSLMGSSSSERDGASYE